MPDRLHEISIVVTRPAQQAGSLKQALQAQGAQVIALPVFAIQQVEDADLQQVQQHLQQLASYDIVVFISANAVRFTLALLDAQQRLALGNCRIAAIGRKTAAALQAQGLAVDFVPAEGFTSEDLLALPNLQQLQGQRILIARGQGGRELLAKTFSQRGAQVDYADTYVRACPPRPADDLKQHHQAQQLDIIALTSSEGIANLLEMQGDPEWIKGVPLLLGSQRMAMTARQLGFTGTLVVADNPGDEAMLRALVQWVQEREDDR